MSDEVTRQAAEFQAEQSNWQLVVQLTVERDQARLERDRAIVDGRNWKQRAEAVEHEADIHALHVAHQQIKELTIERDRARVEADSRYKDWAKAVDACDLLRKGNSNLREQLGWCMKHRTEITKEQKVVLQERDAAGRAVQQMTIETCRLTAERDALKKQFDDANKSIKALTAESSTAYNKVGEVLAELDMERAECEKLRKDLQEITIELEVAEDEAQVFKERLIKEQKVVLQLAEENDRLSIELDSRRTAFLQMVVEMGKVSKEMLSV